MTAPSSAIEEEQRRLHQVSTPIALLAPLGLRTYAGVSGDDPWSTRHAGARYAVILSAFGEGRLLGRHALREIGPREHVFLCLDAELERLGLLERARLCVVHRVPSGASGADFRLFRTVVQYGTPAGAMGGLVYETPPNLNVTGRKPHFLSFTNKLYLGREVDNYLVFLNYSVSADYAQAADVRLSIHDASGTQVAAHGFEVPPYDYACVRVNELVATRHGPAFFSASATSLTSALIPLSVLVDRRSGGVSVEHSHPPQEYWMADWPLINAMKVRAARHLFGA